MSVCEAGGSGSEKLKKCPPLFPAALWFVNGCERKPREKMEKSNPPTNFFAVRIIFHEVMKTISAINIHKMLIAA